MSKRRLMRMPQNLQKNLEKESPSITGQIGDAKAIQLGSNKGMGKTGNGHFRLRSVNPTRNLGSGLIQILITVGSIVPWN